MSSASSSAAATSRRQTGIDAFRVVLCLAVAMLHALPNREGVHGAGWPSLAALVCRSAVPFYFIASGYFLRVPAHWTLATAAVPLRRLLPVYLGWFVIYAAVAAVVLGRPLPFGPRALLTGGEAVHLWFLPVLAATLAAVTASIAGAGARLTAAVSAALAALGLLFGAYHDLFGLPLLPAIRSTMAPLLVMIGYGLARSTLAPAPWLAAVAVAAALLVNGLEEALIAQFGHTRLVSHDVVLSTYAYGTASFLFARSLAGGAVAARIARLGPLALGIYAGHLLGLWLVLPFIGNDRLGKVVLAVTIGLALATLAAATLDRSRLTRWLVR